MLDVVDIWITYKFLETYLNFVCFGLTALKEFNWIKETNTNKVELVALAA